MVMKRRALKRRKQQAVALPQKDGLGSLETTAFDLTDAQRRVIRETLTDLERHAHVATRPGRRGVG